MSPLTPTTMASRATAASRSRTPSRSGALLPSLWLLASVKEPAPLHASPPFRGGNRAAHLALGRQRPRRKSSQDAEIINEHPGEMIAWQTLPGATVQSAGTVRFESPERWAEHSRERQPSVRPSAGHLGATVAAPFLERPPSSSWRRDLAQFKSLLESDTDTGSASP